MAVNKVVYDGETLVDLTGDNVSESTLLSGATAHNAAGEAIVGTVVVPTIDSALSADSTNPVQNKVINTKFTSIQSDIDNKVPLSRTINGKALTTNITLTAADVGALPNTTVIPSIEGLATETYVNNKFASIVDSAPETLDTLKELSDALGNDPNFATTIATQIGGKVDKVSGKGLSSNDYTTNEKNKLAGIAVGAEVNQNTFSNIIIAGTTISAVNKQDSLTLVAGNNITLTPDANNKKITITSKDTVYTHPSYTSKSSGLYKITVDGTGHVSGTTTVTKSDITALGIPAQDTTYSEATTSAAGLMSATDKTKLNGIAEGAEKNVQSDLSQTDNTAIDYVKGVLRNEHLPEGYPYKEIGATILDGTFEFMSIDTSLKLYQIKDENFTIVPGRPYIITWNGVTYECVSSAGMLGNSAIAASGEEGTGEPFLFLSYGVGANYIYTRDTSTTNTITVCEENVHTIAEELLPKNAKGLVLNHLYAEMPNNEEWYSVTYGNSKFVAVESNSATAAYSENGITWAASTMPSSAIWQSVTYGNGKFVAVAYNSTAAAYSTDGITWTATTMPSSANWQSITYGNDKFVAVAYNSTTAAYSADGITWTAATLPSTADWQSVTYGNGKFVVVAYNSDKVAYSTDGITWTAKTLPSSAKWQSVTYGNGKFVSVAYESNTSAYSKDGITWTAATLPSTANWYSVTYGNGKFVAVTYDSDIAAYSEDGITWTAATLTSSSEWRSITYGNGKFVAVRANSYPAAYSEDGINWKTTFEYISQNGEDVTAYIEKGMILKNLRAAMPISGKWYSVTYGNDKFVSVAYESNTSAYSEDGITWTAATMPSSAAWSVTYGNGKFVAVASGSDKAAYSADGITWTAKTLPSSDSWFPITYGNGKFVALATMSTNAAYSTDGVTWTAATMPSDQLWTSIIYGNGKFVAVAIMSSEAFYSADGITWTSATLPSSDGWISVTYGNGKFVAVASTSDKAAYSADGITWTATTLPSSTDWISVTYGNGKFVTVASDSTIAAYSADGINWTAATLPSAQKWYSVTYGNGEFVAVASQTNIVAYSRDGITWKSELKTISQNGEDVTADTLIALEHTHKASKISAGTFAGQVVANASGQTPGTMLLRNSKLVSAEETPTVNGEICWVYS